MLLEALVEGLEEKRITGDRNVDVANLAYDSRKVSGGTAFFCIRGLVHDGHDFAKNAVAAGASALFIEREPEVDLPDDVTIIKVPSTRAALALCASRFFDDPSGKVTLVGVTGTNGKTTTTYLVERICRLAGHKTGLIGTIENRIGDTVEPVLHTTPESLDLQRLLSRMVEQGVGTVVMEVSSHALDLHRVTGCSFDVVVFTNLTQDHLDYHLSIEAYFSAKQRLFSQGELGEERIAVINMDDPYGVRLDAETTVETITCSIGGKTDISASNLDISASGNRFLLGIRGESMELTTRLQGRFNVYNSMSAAGVGLALGIGRDRIKDGIQSLPGVPGRFESINSGQGFTVIVDYAHTPDGIRNLLEACREVTDGRVIIVVGCGGDRDKGKRPLMAQVAVTLSELAVFTSDNPRTEDPARILEMMVEGVADAGPHERYLVEPDRRAAIRLALETAEPGDLVVVAGKGHESGQILSGEIVPFDDREVVREILKEKGFG